jgi:hypothetical protein
MQPLWHGRESEETTATVIVQWPIADKIPHEQEPLRMRVPQCKSKITDQTADALLAPTLKHGEQNGSVAELSTLLQRHIKLTRKIIPIVEANIGHQRQAAITAPQRLVVVFVFWKKTI